MTFEDFLEKKLAAHERLNRMSETTSISSSSFTSTDNESINADTDVIKFGKHYFRHENHRDHQRQYNRNKYKNDDLRFPNEIDITLSKSMDNLQLNDSGVDDYINCLNELSEENENICEELDRTRKERNYLRAKIDLLREEFDENLRKHREQWHCEREKFEQKISNLETFLAKIQHQTSNSSMMIRMMNNNNNNNPNDSSQDYIYRSVTFNYQYYY
ncbi:hypothetical protein BLA29_007440 [Euroglyphus maynei]|uniref:Uncharacterized protein n=1 Tax=Euroglyphus maynei TaxID=6958 RepID=A0A1Y3B268_EURMA|nr:hypothetical protein BLA29_007440 [Euroglyphus maynei]